MTLEEAIAETNNNILFERRMLTVLTSKQTRRVFDAVSSKPEIMARFTELYKTGCVEELKRWLSTFVDTDLGELNVRQLRALAGQYGVAHYYRLSKVELYQEINNAKRRKPNV